jgi:hypothetical protein
VSQTKIQQMILSVSYVVEEVARFDITVNDVVRVDLLQGQEQSFHVLSSFVNGHEWDEIKEPVMLNIR